MVALVREGIDAVAVERFPTFALYRREALLGITRIDGAHGISLRSVLDVLDGETISAESLENEERDALLDADTPASLTALGLALTPEPNG